MRTIDTLIDYVNNSEWLSEVHKQVLVNRINPKPSQEEIERAREEVNERTKR